MSNWTKQALIEEAYDELGLASYNFDLEPEELEKGRRRMDAMWALLESKGIRQGYNFPGDLNADSGLPDGAAEATVCLLALRLAPGRGKTVSPDTQHRATEGYAALMAAAAIPQEQQLRSTLPRGAGNKSWWTAPGRFYPSADTDPLRTSPGGDLEILE